MKSVPVDPNEFDRNVMAIIGIEPVLDFDTGQQKTDRDGAPKWRLQVLYKTPRQRKPDVEEIGFATADLPEPGPMDRPVFVGLMARHWENTNDYGTSSGISLSAETVTFRSPPSQQREPAAA